MPITTLPPPLYEVGYRDYRRQHLYTAKGKEYPSVTKILGIIGGSKSNALMIWARREALKLAKAGVLGYLTDKKEITIAALDEIIAGADRQPDKLKDISADIGSKVHSAIDKYIMGETPILDADSEIGFNNFLAWMKTQELEMVCGDIAVVSIALGFGGRLDAIFKDKEGKLVLGDFKTSNALRDEYPLQVAAYATAFSETYGLPISSAVVIRFGKNEKDDFEHKNVNLSNALESFRAAIKLYNGMKSELWIE